MTKWRAALEAPIVTTGRQNRQNRRFAPMMTPQRVMSLPKALSLLRKLLSSSFII